MIAILNIFLSAASMDVFAKSSVGVQNRPNGCPLPKQLTCVCRSVRTAAAPGLHQIFYPFDFFHDAYDFLQIFIVVAAEWDTASLACMSNCPSISSRGTLVKRRALAGPPGVVIIIGANGAAMVYPRLTQFPLWKLGLDTIALAMKASTLN